MSVVWTGLNLHASSAVDRLDKTVHPQADVITTPALICSNVLWFVMITRLRKLENLLDSDPQLLVSLLDYDEWSPRKIVAYSWYWNWISRHKFEVKPCLNKSHTVWVKLLLLLLDPATTEVLLAFNGLFLSILLFLIHCHDRLGLPLFYSNKKPDEICGDIKIKQVSLSALKTKWESNDGKLWNNFTG